jgi:hypothetical protein
MSRYSRTYWPAVADVDVSRTGKVELSQESALVEGLVSPAFDFFEAEFTVMERSFHVFDI